MIKKIISATLAFFMMVGVMTGCEKSSTDDSSDEYYTSEIEIVVDDNSTASTSEVASGDNQTVSTDKSGNDGSKVYGNVSVKKGTKPVESGLNLGGKTYTMAVWNSAEYLDDAFKNKVKAFQTKYNCKINVVELTFDDYLVKLSLTI